jgi:hypothetical protein
MKYLLSAVAAIVGFIGVQAGEKTQAPKAEPKKSEVTKEKALVPLTKNEKKNLELYKEVELTVIPCESCERRGLFGRKKPVKGVIIVESSK